MHPMEIADGFPSSWWTFRSMVYFGPAASRRLPLEMVGPMFPSSGGLPSYLSHPLFS